MRNVGIKFKALTHVAQLFLASSRQLSLHFDNTNEEADEEIWILLTRHVVDSGRTSDFISLKIEVDDDLRSSSSIVDQIAIAAKVRAFGDSGLPPSSD